MDLWLFLVLFGLVGQAVVVLYAAYMFDTNSYSLVEHTGRISAVSMVFRSVFILGLVFLAVKLFG